MTLDVPDIAPAVVEDLREFVDEVRLHGGRCVFVISPMLKRMRVYNAQNDKLADVAARLDVPLIRYDQAGRFPWVEDPQYYLDQTHLNARGAALLSTDLGTRLATLAAGESVQ